MDLKRSIKISQGGNWITDSETRTQFGYDIWGNVNYGYLGIYVGFTEDILLAGAGVAQAFDTGIAKGFALRFLNSRNDFMALASMDDPYDQEAVRIGVHLWKAHATRLTGAHLMHALRAKSNLLNTQAMAPIR